MRVICQARCVLLSLPLVLALFLSLCSWPDSSGVLHVIQFADSVCLQVERTFWPGPEFPAKYAPGRPADFATSNTVDCHACFLSLLKESNTRSRFCLQQDIDGDVLLRAFDEGDLSSKFATAPEDEDEGEENEEEEEKTKSEEGGYDEDDEDNLELLLGKRK
jgi:hypothetical protein